MSSYGIDRPIHYPGPGFGPIEDGEKPSYWPASYSPASPTSCSLASLSLDPHKDALSTKGRPSSVNTVSNADEKDCMRATIALEYYNKKNGTNYELACALLSKDFKSDGNWVHCNFAAWQPKGDMNVTSSRTLFFAEMHGDDVSTCSWTVTACIVLEGNLTVGCSSCSEVIHPPHGFRQGRQKYEPSPEELKPYKYILPRSSHLSSSYSPTSILPNSYSPTSDLLNPCKLTWKPDENIPDIYPSDEQISNTFRKRAGIALDYYNKENGVNYELVDVLVCKSFLSGDWFHCNFTAKPSNGDMCGESSSKLFFGEVCLSTLTATACVILEEDRKTTDGCNLCLEVIHPTDGFVKGRDKNDVRFDNSKFRWVPIPKNRPVPQG